MLKNKNSHVHAKMHAQQRANDGKKKIRVFMRFPLRPGSGRGRRLCIMNNSRHIKMMNRHHMVMAPGNPQTPSLTPSQTLSPETTLSPQNPTKNAKQAKRKVENGTMITVYRFWAPGRAELSSNTVQVLEPAAGFAKLGGVT